MEEKREYHKVCRCGQHFTSAKRNSVYCEQCRSMRFSLFARYNNQAQHGKVARKDVYGLVERDYVECIENTRYAKASSDCHCLFCGKPVSKGRNFCARCVHEGLHELYSVTHRTNGWDRRILKTDPIVDGWRGQPRMGGKSVCEETVKRCGVYAQ